MIKHAIDTLRDKLPSQPEIIIEHSLKHDMDDLVAQVLPRMSLAIVDDVYTKEAAGERVYKSLQGKFACTHVTFETSPEADDKAARFLQSRSERCDALVAVGSGTISDLCKHVSHMAGKPYIVIPTAASMNGYLSANASITVEGYKKTLAAQMPLAVLCDMGLIHAAPARLNKSGFGDSMARSTAQADWLLSHLLLGTPYDDAPFKSLLLLEEELLANARGIAKNDASSLKLLMQTLLISGLGMTAAGGSYPASQGEHMIAHAYSMRLKHMGTTPMTLHGEEIAITALAMANRQEALLNIEPIFADRIFPEASITELFGAQVAAEAKTAYARKIALIKNREITGWQDMAARISAVIISPHHMQTALSEAGCHTRWAALGWQQDTYLAVSAAARFLRERFTFLDLI